MKENKAKRKNKRKKKRKNQQLCQELRSNYTLNKMVKVNDDWYPTYPKHQVSVHLTIVWWEGYGETIFVVAGADDTAVEKRFLSSNMDELIEKWKEWNIFYDNIPQTTNKRWYLERGFEWA